MKVIIENREDYVEKPVESRLPRRDGYEWVDPLDIVSLRRVSAIDNVFHAREGYEKDFLYLSNLKICGAYKLHDPTYCKTGTNEDMFHKLRNQLDEEAKKVKEIVVLNLKEMVVATHGHFSGIKSSSSKSNSSDLGCLERTLVFMCKGVLIGLKENELKMMKEAEPTTLIRVMLEFQSRSLVLDPKKIYVEDKNTWIEKKKALEENVK
ncbi:hypothetical protein V8G54_005806 [Vigna mungo]|uniref:Uncharacterized protein n=1 Tax=Vigna mungo TaxID=3915 RepID=A0AAQ3S7F5_VIGMU